MFFTTNFEDWMNSLQHKDLKELKTLYRVVLDKKSNGQFTIQPGYEINNENACILEAYSNSTKLILASGKARKAFLRYVHNNFIKPLQPGSSGTGNQFQQQRSYNENRYRNQKQSYAANIPF